MYKDAQILYIFDEIDSLDDAFMEQSIPYLSMERREKAFSYRFPLERNLSAAVYLLLRLALKEQYGINEPVVFTYAKNGKPSLRDYPDIRFNLSHCRAAAACIVAGSEVGVDVEGIAPVPDNAAMRALTAKEYAEFKASLHPHELFCEYWTVKESWLKKTGCGIGADLSVLAAEDTGEKTFYKSGKNYCCCAAGAFVTVRHVGIKHIQF